MALYLLISEGVSEESRAPIFATRDPAVIAAVGREIARRLGVDSPTIRNLRTRGGRETPRTPRGEMASREGGDQ